MTAHTATVCSDTPLTSSVSFDAETVRKIKEKTVSYALSLDDFKEQALSDNVALALHQDHSRMTMLMGVVKEHFLELWEAAFPYDGIRLKEETKESRFKVVFDEQSGSMCRLLMRRWHEGLSVTLGELTAIVFKKPKGPDYSRKRSSVRDKYFVVMEEFWLWDVKYTEGVDKNGNKHVKRHDITAGPALQAFNDVYVEVRLALLKQLVSRVEKLEDK